MPPPTTFPHLFTTALSLILLTLLTTPHPTSAHTNGMSSTSTSTTLASGGMSTYLHFTPTTDILWFEGWVPQSAGAMVGACIGLMLAAVAERWVGAVRAVEEGAWRRERTILSRNASVSSSNPSLPLVCAPSSPDLAKLPTAPPAYSSIRRSIPPFMPRHDVPRGILHAVQSLFGFAFMLAVMTYQVGFILSIVVGLGAGEMLFGRYRPLDAYAL